MKLFSVGAVIMAGRLFMVQVIQHSTYEALASGQHALVKQLFPERGEMYVQDRFTDTGIALLATNRTLHLVYSNPKQMNAQGVSPQVAADAIAPLLGLDPALVLQRFSKTTDAYEPLQHGVTDQELELLQKTLEEKNIKGVYWVEEDSRFYPEGPIAGSLTGFVGQTEEGRKGLYGLEGYFDDQLSGKTGSLNTELDAFGRFIAVGEKSIEPAQDGDTLILTIDKNIQYKACTLLHDAVQKHGAKQGSALVMDPKTGAILALCNAPAYDPNDYGSVEDISVFVNDAVSDQYEPGSVFKPLTMAAAINEGKVTPYTTYEDTGEVVIDGYSINNSDGKAHGTVDMTFVLEESLNTGSIFAVQKVGNEHWFEYVQKFGFGKETGINMASEQAGNISSLENFRDIYSATSSYGQGITVTPIQLLQAYGAIANHGTMMQPYIVDRVVKANGFQEITQPKVAGQPISAEAARTVSAMMVRVVDEGHSQRAAIGGYFMAGKTGTAQVPREDGRGYDPHRHKDTFVGFGPISDPQFVIIIKVDEPQDVQWSEGSTAPIFKEIAQYLLQYLQIPPDRELE